MRQPEVEHPRVQELESRLAAVQHEKKALEEKNFTILYEKKASEQVVTMLREQIKENRKDFFHQMDNLMKEMRETKHSPRLNRLVGAGWRTSMTKILDNAIVAYCRVENLPYPA